MPNGTLIKFDMDCREETFNLYIKIKDQNNPAYSTIIIENY